MSKRCITSECTDRLSGEMSKRAFTFVEVVIALAIVSISLLSLIRLHIINVNMTNSAEVTSQAAFLAQEKMAGIIAAGFSAQGGDKGTFESNSLLFNWRTEVEDVHLPQLDSEKITGLKKISVDIAWQQGTGKKHLRMSTLIADRKVL